MHGDAACRIAAVFRRNRNCVALRQFVLAVADERGAILAHARIPTGRPEETLPPEAFAHAIGADLHGQRSVGGDADAGIDRLAKKYLGKDKYPFRGPGEVRVIYKIRPEKVTTMG